MPSVSEIAWAAGFFDGEGHICISHATSADRRQRKNGKIYFYERFQLRVQISQKDREPIDWLKDKFGGYVRHCQGKRSYDGGNYSRWDWTLAAIKAAEFLQLIRPFLLVKGPEADVAIEFNETMDRARRRKTDPQVVQLRRNAFDKIRQIRLAK